MHIIRRVPAVPVVCGDQINQSYLYTGLIRKASRCECSMRNAIVVKYNPTCKHAPTTSTTHSAALQKRDRCGASRAIGSSEDLRRGYAEDELVGTGADVSGGFLLAIVAPKPLSFPNPRVARGDPHLRTMVETNRRYHPFSQLWRQCWIELSDGQSSGFSGPVTPSGQEKG